MTPQSVSAGISLADALAKAEADPHRLAELFRHGSLEVEFYAPRGVDSQSPHTRDEVYVVARGRGIFLSGTARHRFGPGDFFFVAAGMEHRFEEMSEDFATWVFFYGPEGGEVGARSRSSM